MKGVGFDFVPSGVGADADRILKNLKKGTDIARVEKTIKDACELGFDADIFFLLGSRGETMKGIKQSFSLAQKYPLRRAIFYNLISLPSTQLLRWLAEKSYLICPLEDTLNNASCYLNTPCFYTPEISLEERREALKMEQRIMLKIRRRYIERKIKGPLFLKQIFSFLYSSPLLDDVLVNNWFVVWIKEKIKRV